MDGTLAQTDDGLPIDATFFTVRTRQQFKNSSKLSMYSIRIYPRIASFLINFCRLTNDYFIEQSRFFLLLFLATLAAFGPFVTDFYLPTLPEQTTDFHTSPAMVQLGLSNIMWLLCCLFVFSVQPFVNAVANYIYCDRDKD